MTDGDISPVAGEVGLQIHHIEDRRHLGGNGEQNVIKLRAIDQSTRSVKSSQNGIAEGLTDFGPLCKELFSQPQGMTDRPCEVEE